MKFKTRLKVLAVFIFLAAILILWHPKLLDGQVQVQVLDQHWQLQGLWILPCVLVGCWCLEFLMELVFIILQLPSRFKRWRLEQQQKEAREVCFNKLMTHLWLNPLAKEYAAIKTPLAELTDASWATLQQVLLLREMLRSRNFRQTHTALGRLHKLDRFWGLLWHYQINALLLPNDQEELQKFNGSVTANNEEQLTSSDLARLTPALLNHLADLLQQSGKLTVLAWLLKKANWRSVTNEKEYWENLYWLRSLEAARQESSQHKELAKLWNKVPSKLQTYPKLAKWWFDELCREGSKEAQTFLIKTLEHSFNGLLFKDYVAMATQQKDTAAWQKRAQKWLQALDGVDTHDKQHKTSLINNLKSVLRRKAKSAENAELAADASVASEEMVASLVSAEHEALSADLSDYRYDKAAINVFKVFDTTSDKQFALLSGLGDLAKHLKQLDEAIDYYTRAQHVANNLAQYLKATQQLIEALAAKKDFNSAINLATKSLTLTQQNLVSPIKKAV